MKLPSNQFRDADLSWPACVVNPVRLMAMFATVQHMVLIRSRRWIVSGIFDIAREALR